MIDKGLEFILPFVNDDCGERLAGISPRGNCYCDVCARFVLLKHASGGEGHCTCWIFVTVEIDYFSRKREDEKN